MKTGAVVYLDQAATSHPKPPAVYAVADAVLRAGGSPGRGGHRLALRAGRVVYQAREAVATLLGAEDAARVVFTSSATDSLNLALKGLLQPGDHVITTVAEHNALRRPLAALQGRGVQVTWLPVAAGGLVSVSDVQAALRPTTRLVALHHGSNVTGAVQPVAQIAAVAHRGGAWLLVDAAQTLGTVPLDVRRDGIDLLAAPGHKGLLGPPGTGLLYVGPDVPLRPVREGGTGVASAALEQPAIFPEGFESGTVNAPALAGLGAAVEYVLELGVDAIHRHEQTLVDRLIAGLGAIPGVAVLGPSGRRCSPVTFTVAGMDPAEVEEMLDEDFGVLGRSGLHCNPGAHTVLGTLPLGGAMRLSPGWFNTPADIDRAIAAVTAVATTARV